MHYSANFIALLREGKTDVIKRMYEEKEAFLQNCNLVQQKRLSNTIDLLALSEIHQPGGAENQQRPCGRFRNG